MQLTLNSKVVCVANKTGEDRAGLLCKQKTRMRACISSLITYVQFNKPTGGKRNIKLVICSPIHPQLFSTCYPLIIGLAPEFEQKFKTPVHMLYLIQIS
jgi:hypothetical protein